MQNNFQKSYHAPIQVTPLRKFFIFVLTPILKILAKIKVTGLENLPQDGAAIVACNHLSFFDGFALQLALPRPVFFMGKEENFRNPFLRFFMYQIGAFPVKRGTYDRGALDQALRILNNGQLLGMFPEGTRTYGRGMIEAKGGTAILAIKMKCPIIPIALAGAQDILKKPFKRVVVTLTVCPPVMPEDGLSPLDLTKKYMQVIARNLPPLLRGFYG